MKSKLTGKDVKSLSLTILSLLLAVFASALFLRLLPQQSREFILLWFWFGAFAIPVEGFKEEWKYWFASPMLGLGRAINRFINPWRDEFVLRF